MPMHDRHLGPGVPGSPGSRDGRFAQSRTPEHQSGLASVADGRGRCLGERGAARHPGYDQLDSARAPRPLGAAASPAPCGSCGADRTHAQVPWPTTASDVWALGCVLFEVCARALDLLMASLVQNTASVALLKVRLAFRSSPPTSTCPSRSATPRRRWPQPPSLRGRRWPTGLSTARRRSAALPVVARSGA